MRDFGIGLLALGSSVVTTVVFGAPTWGGYIAFLATMAWLHADRDAP